MLLGVLTAAAVLATLAAAPSTANAAEPRKVLVVGFDGMDPVLLEQYRAAGLLPNLDRVLAQGWVRDELGTTIPPQSPVAWSTFITGLNPGGHGIFDFIHRDPEGPTPFLGWKVPRGEPTIVNRREGAAFWQLLDAAGVDATVFKVPANFPPVDCEARTLSGMGTPDILGTYGIFQYFTDDHDLPTGVEGGNVVPVALDGGLFTGSIPGPRNAYREGDPETEVPFEAVVDRDNGSALFRIGGDEFVLRAGEWSDWVSLDFEMVPLVKSVAGICRFHLIEAAPVLRLYVTPVQIDPRNPEMPISTPGVYSAEVAATTRRACPKTPTPWTRASWTTTATPSRATTSWPSGWPSSATSWTASRGWTRVSCSSTSTCPTSRATCTGAAWTPSRPPTRTPTRATPTASRTCTWPWTGRWDGWPTRSTGPATTR